jgi:Tetratricopeptide repeat
LTKRQLFSLLAAMCVLASCTPVDAPPPAVVPAGDDRYIIDPRTTFTDSVKPDLERRFETAWRFHLAGNDVEARRRLDEIVLKNPNYFPAQLAIAAIDISAQQYDAAMDRINRVKALAGDAYLPPFVYEAEIALRTNDTRRALTLYRAIAGRERAPAIAAERVAQLETALFTELTTAARNAADAESVALLREALTLQQNADMRVLLVQRLIAQKQFDEARRELDPLVNTDPGRNEVQESLAEIDLGRGRFEDAVKRYERLSARTRDSRYAQRLEHIKSEWSSLNLPAYVHAARASEALTREQFAVQLYWTVPSIRFAQNLSSPPIAIDIADVAGRDELIRAIAIGLFEVDAVTRRVSPSRPINAGRLTILTARVLSLRGAVCARGVPSERDELARAQKILAACGVADPSAGVPADTPATGAMARASLEQVAKIL